MKSFWLSIGLCGALALLISWNSVYIHRVCRELTEEAEAIPPCPAGEDALSALTQKWEQENVYIELSVSRHSIDKISDCLYEWESAIKACDEAEYERCRHLFLSAIAQIRRTESVAIGNWV